MPKYDWEKIRDHYVTGDDAVTLVFLVAEYGFHLDTVKRRCALEGWTEQRQQYRHQVATKTRAKASTREAEVRTRHIRLSHAMMKIAMKRLATIDPEDMTISELRLFIKEAADIERKAVGIPVAHEIEADFSIAKLAEEAFKIAKEKRDRERAEKDDAAGPSS